MPHREKRRLINLRADQRYPTSFPATLRHGAREMPVEVLDLSEGGARLSGPAMPPPGAAVAVRANGLTADATVTWSRGESCGVRFVTAIEPLAIVRCNMRVPGARARAPEAVTSLRPSAGNDGLPGTVKR